APVNDAQIEITTAYAFAGEQSLLIKKSDQSNSGFQSTLPMAVTGGLNYAASAYARLPLTIPTEEAANLVLRVRWVDASDSVIQVDSSAVHHISDPYYWVLLSSVWMGPVGATAAYLQVGQPVSGTANAEVIVDAILFEQSNYVGGYFETYTWAE